MSSKRAISRAIEALKQERRALAFDANLFDLKVATYPHAESASIRRKEIEQAILELGGTFPESFAARRLREIAAKHAQQETAPASQKVWQSDTVILTGLPVSKKSARRDLIAQKRDDTDRIEQGAQVALFSKE